MGSLLAFVYDLFFKLGLIRRREYAYQRFCYSKKGKKTVIYQLITNFDMKLKAKEIQLTHRDLSIETGRAEAWYNNSFKNFEDLRISSFLRILAVANEGYKGNTETEFDGTFPASSFHFKSASNSKCDKRSCYRNKKMFS